MSEPIDWHNADPPAVLERLVADTRARLAVAGRRPAIVTDDELDECIDTANFYLPTSWPLDAGHWSFIEVLQVLHRARERRRDLEWPDVLVARHNVIVDSLALTPEGLNDRWASERNRLLDVVDRLLVELVDRDVNVKPRPWQVTLFDRPDASLTAAQSNVAVVRHVFDGLRSVLDPLIVGISDDADHELAHDIAEARDRLDGLLTDLEMCVRDGGPSAGT